MLVSRSGPTMMARIGVMKALNRHVERVFNPDRKDTSLGQTEAQEGPMKTYFLLALAGLIACAIAAMIFMEMTQQIVSGLRARDREGPMTVFVYVNTNKQVGDPRARQGFRHHGRRRNLVCAKRSRRRGLSSTRFWN